MSAGLVSRVASASLVACLVMAPVGALAGGLALAQVLTAEPQVASAAPVDRSGDRAIAGEMARTVVVTWLTTTSEHPERLTAVVRGASLGSLSRQAFTVADPDVAGITEVDAATWSVVVAATVTDSRGITARRFYQVPVQVVRGDAAALALPAPVAGPGRITAAATDYRFSSDRTSSAGQTVDQFLAAYSAGQGELSRYLTPGVSLQPISPAPYTSVRLEDLRSTADLTSTKPPVDRTVVRVLATASGTVTEDQRVQVMYALTLTARAGRWEVTGIDQAPALAKTPATAVTGAAVGVQETTATPTKPAGTPASTPIPTPTR